MQLTIDSTEPLDRVLTVVSSLYGVELAVVSEGPAPARATSAPRPQGASRSRGGRAARKSATAPATRADTARKAAPAKRATGNGRPRRSPAADLAAVRSWARANGFQVSDRGRVSNAVLKAYEESQRSSS